MRRFNYFLAALVVSVISTAEAAERAYPTKPIRLIVPYVPGGGVDFVGRTVAQKLSETWSHPVVVDNRPGGGTNIGSELVARAAPDGHTLLVGGVPNTVNMTLYKKLPYDVVRDFAPVSRLTTAPNILVVHPSVPAKSVKELIALAKSRRGELTYASAGIGSSNHLGTPQTIISKLHAEVVRILRLPEITERLATQGVEVVASSPAEFAAFIKQDVAKYAKLVRTAGIRID